MSISICCCWNPKKPTKPITDNPSPNVIDVYTDAFNHYEPITIQPIRQKRPKKSLNDGLVHDLKRYENDPKGFNNFAFVDEIDLPIKSEQERLKNIAKLLELNKLKENSNQSLANINDLSKYGDQTSEQERLKNIAKQLELNKLREDSNESLDNINELSRYGDQTSEQEHFKNIIKQLELNKLREDSNESLDNIDELRSVKNDIENIARNNKVSFNDSIINNGSYVETFENLDNNEFFISPSTYSIKKNNNCIVTIIKDGKKTGQTFDIKNSPFYNKNQNTAGHVRINNNRYEDYFVENALKKFIENSGLTSNFEYSNSNYNMPIECYATIQIHDEHLMTAVEIQKKIPKRKFPNAFDKKIVKSNDLKRKPATNLIKSKVQLLKDIPSDYSYAAFRLATLEAHNEFRANHGCPPLVESMELNEIAKDWAHHLAINNYEIYHRPNNKFGENLYWTSNPLGHAIMAVKVWYNEIELYDYSNPGFTKETGHFTQLLWKDTTELGTGIAKIGNVMWIVCNYNPPGNILGRFNDLYVPRLIK